jgi:protein-disulfide isomerase/serine/threonine protein kinase
MARGVQHQRGDLIAGKYSIFREVSSGEASTRFAAENRSVGRPCAIEIIHPDRISDASAFLERLRQVGRIGSHPNIVEVFDTGIDDANGAPFIAMELLEGESLREHLALHSPVPGREVAKFIEQMGDALGQAHAAGVVHGGLRSDRLFVVRDRKGENVIKMLDFGVADALGLRSAYAAPEQLAGRALTPATDVFALALVAYELFTGHGVLQYWNARDVDAAHAMVEMPRVAASRRAGLESLRLPPGFDRWFERATAVDPSARHASVGDATRDLVALVGGPKTAPLSPQTAPEIAPLATLGAPVVPVIAQPSEPPPQHTFPSQPPPLAQSPAQASSPPHHAPSQPPVAQWGGGGWGAPPGAVPPPNAFPPPGAFPDQSPPTRRPDTGAPIVLALIVLAILVVAGGGFMALRLAASDPPVASAKDDDDGGVEGGVEAARGARGTVPASHATASVPVTDRDPIWGDNLAPVTIVVFSDFECPFCSRVESTLTALRSKYGERELRIVWKDYPLPFHKNAMAAHEAAQAVFELGGSEAFWKFHASAFADQKSLTSTSFDRWATAAGVSASVLQRQLAGGGPSRAVQDDLDLGKRIGVKGTPAFYVNGVFLSGAQPQAKFEAAIDDQALAARSSAVPAAEVYPTLTNKNLASPSPSPTPSPVPSADTTVYNVPVSRDDPQKGPADALVTIVEFSEFQCPFCKRVQPALEQVMTDYSDVRLVWKDNPLAFHNRAEPAAMAAREVFAQKGSVGFWKMHDLLFRDQLLDDADLLRFATEAGASGAKVRIAIDTNAHSPVIKDSQALASSIGAAGTPSFFINGRKLTGAQPYDQFKDLIDEQLADAKARVASGTPRASLYEAIIKGGKGPEPPETKHVAVPSDAPFKGNASAPVVIQVFSDFQCPFCKRLVPTLEGLLTTYPDKVKIVFRHNPLPFHSDAPLAHQAAMEAYAQKGNAGFWKMHDALFGDPRRLERADLEGHAKEQGLDMVRFNRALDTGLHQKRIDQDVDDAKRAGISGAPASLVNDFFVSGAQPASKFEQLIQLALRSP